MKVSGSHVVGADRQQVWAALQDPGVLVRTIPGCQEMREVGDDTYEACVEAGIASIKGSYDGRVRLSDQDPPHSYTLRATGSGGPGTIDATARVSLIAEGDDRTRVDYDAHAVVGGPIAGVGQRVVAGVAKRNAKLFFEAVDQHLNEQADATADTDAPGATSARDPGGGVIHYRPDEGRYRYGSSAVRQLLTAAAAGAAIALAGVLVGQRRR